MSEYYTPTGYPITLSQGASKQLRDEFVLVEELTDKLPTLSGNGSKPVFINSAGTGMESVSGAVAIANMGITATVAELNYMDGVTSNVQTQLDSIAALPDNVVVMSAVNDTTAGRAVTIFSGTNIFLGLQSGESAVVASAVNNSGYGERSLELLTTGTGCSAFGARALQNVIEATDIGGFGKYAFQSLVTGQNSIAVGSECASNVTDISSGTYLGAGITATESANNEIAFGQGVTGNGSNSVTIGNASVTKTVLRGNVLIGGTTSPTNSTVSVSLFNGTAPSAVAADSIALYSSDLSAGNTMLSLWTEGTPVASVAATSPDRTIAIRVNGTVYYLHAKTTND